MLQWEVLSPLKHRLPSHLPHTPLEENFHLNPTARKLLARPLLPPSSLPAAATPPRPSLPLLLFTPLGSYTVSYVLSLLPFIFSTTCSSSLVFFFIAPLHLLLHPLVVAYVFLLLLLLLLLFFIVFVALIFLLHLPFLLPLFLIPPCLSTHLFMLSASPLRITTPLLLLLLMLLLF